MALELKFMIVGLVLTVILGVILVPIVRNAINDSPDVRNKEIEPKTTKAPKP